MFNHSIADNKCMNGKAYSILRGLKVITEEDHHDALA